MSDQVDDATSLTPDERAVMIDRKRVPIRQAAKIVGRDYRYLRRLAVEGQITAYRHGESVKRPWLEFYIDELRADLDMVEQFKRVVVAVERKPRRIVLQTMHPAAAAM